ncbi:hypothetical protein HPB48_011434 [Haemaphysalis longicornis]|uniref:SWIM-type domain-containing protein n=1 Tax=Haemaphysalis longicornis TaxID=44386 RepID=A0A9J6G938_HAELO|nr:hypothetical protein HPB48_011434 [Haemaphysalis longicornis]
MAQHEPLNAGYYSGLIGTVWLRYEEKVKLCDGIDLYKLWPGVDTSADRTGFPDVTQVDVVTYLVFSANFVTLEHMKAYKALESHYFTSDWAKHVLAKQLHYDKVVLLGEVIHSQRLQDQPLHVWILCKKSRVVLTAHCTCMAGEGEACFHVGARLACMQLKRVLR